MNEYLNPWYVLAETRTSQKTYVSIGCDIATTCWFAASAGSSVKESAGDDGDVTAPETTDYSSPSAAQEAVENPASAAELTVQANPPT